MTDEDRYCQLGKGFKAVRAALCSPGAQEDAAATAASYVLRQVRKDLDLKGGYAWAVEVIQAEGSLFGSADVRANMERELGGSAAGEDFLRAVRQAVAAHESVDRIVERFATTVLAATTGRSAVHQDYRDDTELRDALERHGPQALVMLNGRLREACGIEHSVKARGERESQAELLEFVVLRQ